MKKISTATERNFKKLNKSLEEHEFSSRANKRESKRRIIPEEYYSDKSNVDLLLMITDKVVESGIEKGINSLIISRLLSKKLCFKDGDTYRSDYKYIDKFICNLKFDKNIVELELPLNENDPIGIVYQQALTEGEKNKKGSYYTPKHIIQKLIKETNLKGKKYCDPCCGSGSFLIESCSYVEPENIYGFDIDSIAVNISRANLFERYPNVDFNEQIKCKNFLTSEIKESFDAIITNPPWGSMPEDGEIPLFSKISSNESFSFFIEKAIELLNDGGILNFVLPISILNVKVHKDIRNIILSCSKVEKIGLEGKCFKGVLTDVITLELRKGFVDRYSIKVVSSSGDEFKCPVEYTKENENKVFILLDSIDQSIFKKIIAKKKTNLSNAKFALGIVTGDNKGQLKTEQHNDLRPILTGKEIGKYFYKQPQFFIEYDRSKFQQVCSDDFFAEKTKFLYKFISKKLVFSIDDKKNLALNSANILVLPNDFELNNESFLAIINSNVMNYFFIKKVNQVKILKEDLKSLPLPVFPFELQQAFVSLLKNGEVDEQKIEQEIYKFYELNDNEIARVEEVCNGRIK